mmetsp:Transcript_48256/g.114370  ORF Transcript_48256/g.114370 Transcript_48256/m.114370 type:complete len:267 (-) Transcript_48256:321-1121(-)
MLSHFHDDIATVVHFEVGSSHGDHTPVPHHGRRHTVDHRSVSRRQDDGAVPRADRSSVSKLDQNRGKQALLRCLRMPADRSCWQRRIIPQHVNHLALIVQRRPRPWRAPLARSGLATRPDQDISVAVDNSTAHDHLRSHELASDIQALVHPIKCDRDVGPLAGPHLPASHIEELPELARAFANPELVSRLRCRQGIASILVPIHRARDHDRAGGGLEQHPKVHGELLAIHRGIVRDAGGLVAPSWRALQQTTTDRRRCGHGRRAAP